MRITDTQLARFNDMVRDFAMRHGLGAETETKCLSMERTDVCLSGQRRFKRYTVIWSEVRSLTDAGTTIFSDAMNFFGLAKPYVDAFEIHDVIFNDPATIVFWKDGTKTVVKCQEDDIYSEEVGLALCFAKKALGNKSNYNNVFKKWIPELAPCDQMAAQNAIKQLMANKAPSAAEIMAEFKKHMHKQRGATDQV